jgi:hypothetical protein
MAKYRKMLVDINAPYLQSLMRIIETQSNKTISLWCIGYAKKHILPLWDKDNPNDLRPASALNAAFDYLDGKTVLSDVKKLIKECRVAAKENEVKPIALGAARTIDACSSSVYNPSASLGLALYGSLTLAYAKKGIDASWESLELLAIKECGKMEAALIEIAIQNKPNPAKIKWGC